MPPEPMVQILINFTEMYLIMPSTKFEKMVPLRWLKGQAARALDKIYF